VLALKKNQNSLCEDVQEYFSDEKFQKEIRESENYKKHKKKRMVKSRSESIIRQRILSG